MATSVGYGARTRYAVISKPAVRNGHQHMTAFNARPVRKPRDFVDVMRAVRAQIRDRTNTVWFELLVAARIEPELRTRLAPVAYALIADVERAAIDTLGPDVPPELARLLATSLIHMFDGEAIFRSTYPRPELEDARIDYVADAYRLLAQSTGPDQPPDTPKPTANDT